MSSESESPLILTARKGAVEVSVAIDVDFFLRSLFDWLFPPPTALRRIPRPQEHRRA